MFKKQYTGLVSDIIIFGIGTIGSKLIIFLLLPIYTNVLTSEEYGMADLVFCFSEILRPFISISIYNGLQRYGLSQTYNKEEAFYCANVVFWIGTIVSIVVTPVFGWYKAISEWRWYLSAYAVTIFASKNVLIFLKISDKNKLYSALSLLQAFILGISNIMLLVVLEYGVRGYLLANILAPAFITVIGFFFGGGYHALRTSSYNSRLMKEMIAYSLPFIINDISWWLIHSSDKFMIEQMMGANALGIYTVASKIPLLVNVIASIFSQAWDLSVIREYEKDNDKNYYSKIFKYYIVAVNAISIIIISVIKPFMQIYVGHSFQSAWQFVPLLLSATTFCTLDAFSISFFSALKRSKVIMWPTIFGGILNVIVNYVFITYCGIWGAVLGTLCAYIFMSIVHYRLLYSLLKFNLHIVRFISNCMLTLIMALLVGIDFHISIVVPLGLAIFIYMDRKEVFEMISFLSKGDVYGNH